MRSPREQKVGHSFTRYRRVRPGERFYNQFLLGATQSYVSVNDGDIIAYRVESNFLGAGDKPENVYHHYEVARVLGEALCDGAGKKYEKLHFIVLQLDTTMTTAYERHVPCDRVVWSMPPNSPFLRWFFTGNVNFAESDKLLRIARWGALSERYFDPDSNLQADYAPPRDCPCWKSMVLADHYLVRPAYDFELWLTERGLILHNGTQGFGLVEGARVRSRIETFLCVYRHLSKEVPAIERHAEALDAIDGAQRVPQPAGT